jgi:Rad3-related DNA helicase
MPFVNNFRMKVGNLLSTVFPTRPLLILDEAHELPSEVLKFQSFSITKTKWQKYLIDFQIPNSGYDDVRGWIEFLIELKENILKRIRVNTLETNTQPDCSYLLLSLFLPLLLRSSSTLFSLRL